MMNMSYCFYMAEDEGLLPTKTGKLNAVIADVKKYPEPSIDLYHLERILNKHGLTCDELTEKDFAYIENGIR